MSNVEQVFQARFNLLLNSGLASRPSIAAALDTLYQLEQITGIGLDEELGAPLATHLATTLNRLMKGEVLKPAPDVLWVEIKNYPVQLELANRLVAGLEQRLELKLPPDEAGFIAVHLARIGSLIENPAEASNPSTREER